MTLQAPYLPDDFSSFWRGTVDEADDAPTDFQRTRQQTVKQLGLTIDLIEFPGVKGDLLQGWFAYPESGEGSNGFLWLTPYGRSSMQPNQYGTRSGFCSLSFNHHGESAFYEQEYKPEHGYFADGIADPETWVFRRLFQDSFIAVKVLLAQEEVFGSGVSANGFSQGGGLAIWLGAMHPAVRCVVADMPFGAARPHVFNKDIRRYPLKEVSDWMAQSDEHRRKAMRTMSYFDTVNLATVCDVPTLVARGLRDPAVKSYEVMSVFEALPGEKKLVEVDCGHEWHASMVERNREWMRKQFSVGG
ncbi:MAG: acetylxylan esterase [Armatimonadetes bacterium]|nr:acetylxylan esterase [Armatimonadota bacterium]